MRQAKALSACGHASACMHTFHTFIQRQWCKSSGVSVSLCSAAAGKASLSTSDWVPRVTEVCKSVASVVSAPIMEEESKSCSQLMPCK